MDIKRTPLMLLAALLTLTLVGLPGVAQGQAVKNPDTLIYASFGSPETLDPAYMYDDASYTAMQWTVYETLVFFSGGSTGLFVPMLASEVPSLANGGVSKDARTYTFKIRQGVKFQDGSPMTAEDVKYSLLRFMFMDRDGGPSWILLSPILGVGGTRDDKGVLRTDLFAKANQAIQVKGNTVSITLKEPFAPFMAIMANLSMVVSKKSSAAQGDWDGTPAGLRKLNNPEKPESTTMFSKGNGTGPFKLVQWDRQTNQIILERNDAYWRAPARLKRVILRTVDDFAARRLMLQQGDADIISVNRVELTQVQGLQGVRIIDDLSNLANVGIFFTLKLDTAGNPDVGSGRLDGNGIPGDFFADVSVRRAIAQSIDYPTLIRDCYRNKGFVGHGPIPRGMFGYNPNQQWYPYDRDRATAAFREARGGQVWNTGFTFTILFNTGNATRQCVAQVIKTGIEALNPKFKVNVRSLAWPQYLSAYAASKLPMFVIGWGADYPDAENFVTAYQHSEGTWTSGQGYKNPEVDKLIQQVRSETDPAKRRAIFYKLQEIAYNDVISITLDSVALRVMRTWVRGWFWNPAYLSNYYFYTMSKQ